MAEALEDFTVHGYDSQERLDYWEAQIREAIRIQMSGRAAMEAQLREQLRVIYDRLVKRGGVLSRHQGVSRFTLQSLAPRLHSELERRILASAQLIKLNRDVMIQKTLQRFSGWATSIPKGGSETVEKRKLKQEISKPLRSLPFVERRVLIDQGHKLTSSISATVAYDGGAIAAKWSSHWRQLNYDYREDHKERDGKIYLIRNSWAKKAGFVVPGKPGYADDITQPAEEPFCQCKFVYFYHLRQLPDDMLTVKGREALKIARAS